MDLFQGTRLLFQSFLNTVFKIAAASTVSSVTWQIWASFDGSFPCTGAVDPQTLAVSTTHNFMGICVPPSAISAEMLSPSAFHVADTEAIPYLWWPCSNPSPVMPHVITSCLQLWKSILCLMWATDLWQYLDVSCFPFFSSYSLHLSFLFMTAGQWASVFTKHLLLLKHFWAFFLSDFGEVMLR